MVSATLKSGEEIIEQDALARLHFSPFALGGLLLAIGRARLRGAPPARTDRRNDVLGVYLGPSLCIVALVLGGSLGGGAGTCAVMMQHAAGLGSFGGAAALGPGREERGGLGAHGAVRRVLLDDGLLLLDDLLELLLAQLAQKLFVEDGHYTAFLLLCDQLLQKNGLIILRRHM